MSLQALLWVIALIIFVVAAFWNPPRVSLLCVGLAVLTLGLLVPGFAVD